MVSRCNSLPIYVMWDEWAIVSDLVTALQSAVSGDAAYTTAQTALVSCMNGGSSRGSGGRDRVTGNATSTAPVGRSVTPIPSPTPTPTYASFDDILSRYTGDTKAKMDEGGACSTQAEAMFDTVESLSGSKLAALKTGSTEYAALLEIPHGKDFETSVGDAHIIKRYAFLLASASPNDSSDASDASRASSSQSTGLDCLPSSQGQPTTTQGNLDVLNCLVFDTPHSFSVDQSLKTIDTNALKASGRYNWLGYENWDCSRWFDGPLPSCLKHDVSWGSLRKFVGGVEDDILDEAWNPRNKYLADERFFTDIKANGCQNRTSGIGPWSWCLMPSIGQAFIMQFGVRRINSKNWPYTRYDLEHIDENYWFTEYYIPRVIDVQTSKSSSLTTQRFAVNWTYDPGTVQETSIAKYSLCWKTVIFGITIEDCMTAPGNALSSTLSISKLSIKAVRSFISASVWPNRRLVGFGGTFYPPQEFDLEYE